MRYKEHFLNLKSKADKLLKEYKQHTKLFTGVSSYHPWLREDMVASWLKNISNYHPVDLFKEKNMPYSPVVHVKGCAIYEMQDIVLECLLAFNEVNFIGQEREYALWEYFSKHFTEAGFKLYFNEPKTIYEKFIVFKEGQLNTSAVSYLQNKPHLMISQKKSVVIFKEIPEQVNEQILKLMFDFFGTTASNAKLILLPKHSSVPAFLDKIMPNVNLISNARYANHYEYARGLEMLSNKHHYDSGQFIFVESAEIPANPAVYNLHYYSPDKLDEEIEHLKEKAAIIYQVEKTGAINFVYRNFSPFL